MLEINPKEVEQVIDWLSDFSAEDPVAPDL